MLAIVWLALGSMFEDSIERLTEDSLKSRLLEIAGLLEIDDLGRPTLVSEPADPRYQRPAGGAYWKIEEGGKTISRSESLWDFDFTPSYRRHFSPTGLAMEARGPNGSIVYLAQREVKLEGVGGVHKIRIEVAVDTALVQHLRESFGRHAIIALAFIGLALSLGIWIQASFALRPLKIVRQKLSRIRLGVNSQMDGDFPREIQPLVEDLNRLLERQDNLVRRARERAGDLAHGLKTPLTIIQSEARSAAQRGDAKTAALLREQVAAMNRHVDRELRRARMSGAPAGGGALVDARETVDRLIRTVQRLPGGEILDWANDLSTESRLRMDPDDFGEIVGNVLDNARKHARSRVRVFIDAQGGGPRLCFDDDGPGIPPEDRERLVKRGERAISDGDGSGLGLSIVVEALERYGLELSIEKSSLGGCRLSFPAAGLGVIPDSQGSPGRKAPLKRSALPSVLAGRRRGPAGRRL